MEPSPLTQVSRPDTFQPKIVRLYETLFREDEEDDELSEGFWEEFFLLRPDTFRLKQVLDDVSADELLHLQERSQQLFLRATARIRHGRGPSDEAALDTLIAFFHTALSKRYTNPSSDIISIVAGLDNADVAMSDFVASLDFAIRSGRTSSVKLRAIQTALSIVAGAYQTGLISYFTHRDLFPSLMKYVQDCKNPAEALPACYLLGLLVNYNKFEFQNPYRFRLDDFVNDSIIQKIITCFGGTCLLLRDKYVAVQDDMPEGWTLSTTLSYIGLGALAGSRPSSPVPAPEEAKSILASLPGPEAGVLLFIYDFANANKLVCFNLVTLAPEKEGNTPPLSSFLSLTSYLFQHAHRSHRSTLYTYITLFILQILVEDPVLLKRLCSEESKISVRQCRQRPPFLPFIKGDRIAGSVILDLMVDGINHNLRRKLDTNFYILCIGIVLRILSYLSKSKTRIVFHWSELWRSLLAFFRFLTTYASDIKSIPKSSQMIESLVNLLAFALSNGESFFPDSAAYDDFIYKLVETGDMLVKFRDTFRLSASSAAGSINTLIGVSSHYYALLEGKKLSPREVSKVIKLGYDTLSIEAGEGLDRWDRFREADHKTLLKKITRVVVEDTRSLVD
ncbi:DUF1741-domain-containing protein [Delitschia confertaspora ATCC 74209]|uniref:DUF1741-domain-containing protein n=1 Tax=Delitschia confertaspora ATCC 74209 TaxID=1513339 RepID=A0A9P4MNK2_9PLEO|nr:DUF1741-domain-containing protein [Delitschia confertaspora ATCC 74209]